MSEHPSTLRHLCRPGPLLRKKEAGTGATPEPKSGGNLFGLPIGGSYTPLNFNLAMDRIVKGDPPGIMEAVDFLVVGSGLAGLSFALTAAERGEVLLLAKRELEDGNTSYAQGGIAAALGEGDDPERHAADTLASGCGICHPDAVDLIVHGAPNAIRDLAALGVPFERDAAGQFELGREGGHSERRIVHAHDATGRAIMQGVLEKVRRHPRIRVYTHHIAVDLILERKLRQETSGGRCLGAYVHDVKTREIIPFVARTTVLATGGSGKVYRYTSNPDVATGDGLAMAWRAGCRVANLEFVQFHPTCLYHPDAKDFLISEAVRGEGGFLTTLSGDRLEIDHPLRDLAPRDIVARAIDRAMKTRGDHCVLLHVEHMDADRVRRRFPMIYETCLRFGVDVTRQPIPVVPAAHYQCGGVVTDLEGHTDLEGLYAAGEVAHIGLHGANRLASNSLLEAAVMGRRAAHAAAADLERLNTLPEIPPWDVGTATLPRETVLIDAHWDLVRKVMWDFVGIVRTDHRLELARGYLEICRRSIESYYWDFVLDRDLIELRNLALVAELIVAAASRRKESRGLHFNQDHPERNDADFGRDTLLAPERSRGA